MAQEFVDGGFNLKTLMRKIAGSEAYQLSSRYEGEWKPDYERLFARKLVRRLWAEEVHDAVVAVERRHAEQRRRLQFDEFQLFPGWFPLRRKSYFRQHHVGHAAAGREDQPGQQRAGIPILLRFHAGRSRSGGRRGDGSVLQALNLMNDPFISSRVDYTRAPKSSLLFRYLGIPAGQLIDNFYLTVLSRYPTADEKKAALQRFQDGSDRGGARRACSGRSITKWISCSITDRSTSYEQQARSIQPLRRAGIRTPTCRSSTGRTSTRRQFFQLLGAGVTGSMLLGPRPPPPPTSPVRPVTMQNKAKNVIFILLTGAPSHTDTFDFKMSPASRPPFAATGDDQRHRCGPPGLLPKMAGAASEHGDRALGARAWALVHSLSQTLGADRPESGGGAGQHRAEHRQRGGDREGSGAQAGQVFPTFLALNANNQAGPGYFSAKYAPFKLTSQPAQSGAGLAQHDQRGRPARVETAGSLLHELDDPLRVELPATARRCRIMAISTIRPRG